MQSPNLGDLSISVLGPSAEQMLKANFQSFNTCLLDISNSQAMVQAWGRQRDKRDWVTLTSDGIKFEWSC